MNVESMVRSRDISRHKAMPAFFSFQAKVSHKFSFLILPSYYTDMAGNYYFRNR